MKDIVMIAHCPNCDAPLEYYAYEEEIHESVCIVSYRKLIDIGRREYGVEGENILRRETNWKRRIRCPKCNWKSRCQYIGDFVQKHSELFRQKEAVE